MAKYCVSDERVAVNHSTPLGALIVVWLFAATARANNRTVAGQVSGNPEVSFSRFQHGGSAALQCSSNTRSELVWATSALRVSAIGARQRQEVGVVTDDAGRGNAGGHHVIA
jgi:hypothetical protein